MIDTSLRIFNSADLTVGGATALNTVGTEVTIGASGLHRNAQAVAIVNGGGDAGGTRDLYIDIELSLDGGFGAPGGDGLTPGVNTVATLHFKGGFAGQRVVDIGRMIPWEQYPGTDLIQMRATCRSPAVAAAGDWNAVSVYIGSGEQEFYGRKAGAAETLVGDV